MPGVKDGAGAAKFESRGVGALKPKPPKGVRPTTQKILESLLATLQPYWENARVLDLFAGTGTLAKAALQEGAAEVVCVEAHPHVPLPGKVIKGKLPAALSKLEGTFDVILADPPYNDAAGPATLRLLAPLLASGGWAVFEHHHKDDYPDEPPGLRLQRRKRFGETALSYYRRV